jgi:L-asparaginase / beta-aspartyl-peptidase
MEPFTLVIHGGAGTIRPADLTPELEADYKLGLQNALDAGYSVLKSNGSSIDAVLAAVVSLEDCILFNAGRGAVFAKDGSQEMDASIMEGKERKAGAVAAVKNIKNPVLLANAVMRHSEHVLMMGSGAEAFARLQNIETMPDEYFFSEFRYKQWQQVQDTSKVALDHNINIKEKKFGTVGAVALDSYGNIAAATSTGGMTNKQFGRVGDSPIIGAGTYANNNTCAISCTGHGEPFIKAVTAYDVSCLMEYKALSLEEAMNVVVNDKLLKIEGEGGMIGVDAKGNAAMVFNSEGMYRGVRAGNGRNEVAIYK